MKKSSENVKQITVENILFTKQYVSLGSYKAILNSAEIQTCVEYPMVRDIVEDISLCIDCDTSTSLL